MKQYQELLREALESGEPHADRTGVGTRSLFVRGLRHDMREGFPLLTTKRVPMRWVATELEWMLRGRTDEGWLRERGVDIWREWATAEKCARWGREEGDLGPTYGEMLRRYPIGHAVRVNGNNERYDEMPGGWPCSYRDQLSDLVTALREQPQSRRNVVTLWHPHWATRVDVPPCLLTLQLKAHGERELSLHASFRSSDLLLGLPFDMAAMGLLLELLAGSCGRRPRELVLTLCDAHLYDNHHGAAVEVLSRVPRPLPTLSVCHGGPEFADFEYDLVGYDPWPAVRAEVAV